MNAQGCLWAMIVGFALGLFRMLVDTPVTLGLAGFENGYTPGSFLWIVNNIYFQYFSVLITLVSAVVAIVVQPRDGRARLREDREPHLRDRDRGRRPRETRASWDWRDVAGSGVVLAASWARTCTSAARFLVSSAPASSPRDGDEVVGDALLEGAGPAGPFFLLVDPRLPVRVVLSSRSRPHSVRLPFRRILRCGGTTCDAACS